MSKKTIVIAVAAAIAAFYLVRRAGCGCSSASSYQNAVKDTYL
jgi:hypothetical protein